MRAALALAALLAAGCAGSREGGFDSPVPGARADAVEATARAYRRTRALPDAPTREHLVECLRSDDPLVRFLAINTLEEMTGTTRSYRHDDPEPIRALTLPEWRLWAVDPATAGFIASQNRPLETPAPAAPEAPR